MKKSDKYSRREFLKKSTIASSAVILPLPGFSNIFSQSGVNDTESINVSIFSKTLQFLDYNKLSEVVKEMGFDGIDLTVRRKGHVLPERVVEDLPKATEIMKSFGLQPQLFSTNVSDANDSNDKIVLETASKLGYKTYRTAWFKYKKDEDILETADFAKTQLSGLATLNSKLGLIGGYQNHSGNYFGSALWDLHGALQDRPTDGIGCQYDIMHSVADGGRNWETGFRLIAPYINSIVLKDFLWVEKDGKWVVKYVPIGEGMVDFNRFFSLVKKYKINVPYSIHVEYDLGGAEHGKTTTMDHKEIYRLIKHDLDYARKAYKDG